MIEVHKQLGCGFLEPVYQESLAIEFANRNIPFRREVQLPIHYKGQLLVTGYCADFICFESIVVELKALARMSGTEESQVINYLKATGYEVGLLLNFGSRSLEQRGGRGRRVGRVRRDGRRWGAHVPRQSQREAAVLNRGPVTRTC